MGIRVPALALVVLIGACGGSGAMTHVAGAPSREAAAARPPSAAEMRAETACMDLRALRETGPLTPGGASDAAASEAAGSDAAVCGISDEPLGRLEAAIAAEPEPLAVPASLPWDGTTPLRYLDRIDARFSLSARERSAIRSNGFVVAERLRAPSYGEAMREIVQSQLPLFFSADALLGAVHAGREALVVALEQRRLEPALRALLAALACALPATRRAWPARVAHDVDLYVSVARALLREGPNGREADAPDGGDAPALPSTGESDEIDVEAQAIVRALIHGGTPIAAAAAPSAVLERARAIDPSLFEPRGHYASPTLGLTGYFRSAVWLSHLALSLGPDRSCEDLGPDDKDRRLGPDDGLEETVDALALAELIERAGAQSDLQTLDRAWSLFAERRHDVSMTDLAGYRAAAGIRSLSDPLLASKLRSVLDVAGGSTKRGGAPDDCRERPAIATMLAPRVDRPAAPTHGLVADAVPQRTMIHAAEIAYALGNDRAKTYLAGDLARWPTLAAGLDRAREEAAMAQAGDDLYGAWLEAIRGLAEGPSATAPAFMRTNAWRDLRLNTTVAALGQLRSDGPPPAGASPGVQHDGPPPAAASPGVQHDLAAAPDAWVEPAAATLDALIAYAAQGARAMTRIDPQDTTRIGAYFRRLARVLAVLRKVVERELSGGELSDEQRRFLSMITQYDRASPGCSGDACARTTCSGWWFDLFVDRVSGATSDPELLADYFVSSQADAIGYVGVGAPRLGIFVVDANGPPRAMVGPVASAFEYVGPRDPAPVVRDSTPPDAGSAPWSASYTVPAP